MSKRSNIENQRFGHLVALCPTRSNKRGQMYWLCKCDCGNEKEILSTHLLSGKIKSCGCAKNTVDGLSIKYPRLYSIYYGMIKRCYDINNEAYKNYGGRGIRVCNEWVREPNNFIKWALQFGDMELNKDKLTLDRIDTNDDYKPSNCRWVNMESQANNRRNNITILFYGNEITISNLSKLTKISYSKLLNAYHNGSIYKVLKEYCEVVENVD